MAKNKNNKGKAEEVEKDEVTFEEEVGGESGEGGGAQEGFFAKNRFYIIAAAVILVGAFLYNRYGGGGGVSTEDMEAQGLLARAEVQFERDSFRLALNGDAQYPGLLSIIDDYSGTEAANMATYYAGISYLRMGDLASGISYLEEFDKGDNQVAAASYAALGYAYEQQGQFEQAAEEYQKASTTPDENPYTTPFYLMDVARAYELAGNNGKALEVYVRIRDEYPNSTEVASGNIYRYIAKLDPGA